MSSSEEAQINPLVFQIEELALLANSLIDIQRKNQKLAEMKKRRKEYWERHDKING